MIRRILCFLAAGVLLLLPWTAPAEDNECPHKHWELRNVKASDVGVPGYTGDKYCLDCHTVFQRGKNTPALDPPAGSAMDGSQDQSPGQSEKTPKPTAKPTVKPTAKPTAKPKPKKKNTSAPAVKTTPAPKKQKEPARQKKKQTETNETAAPGRLHFSKQYPFRRVRMNPVPGLRAEPAGILLWPRPASPLQQLLNGD